MILLFIVDKLLLIVIIFPDTSLTLVFNVLILFVFVAMLLLIVFNVALAILSAVRVPEIVVLFVE